MFRDFEQSTFSLELQGFHNALIITNGNMNDSSQADMDHSFYLSTSEKTPLRLNNMTSSITETHDGSF